MQTMFLIILIVFFQVEDNEKTEINVYTFTNSPIEDVFVGQDNDMDLFGDTVIAISPTITENSILIPESIEEAMTEMKNLLPMWYKIALVNGKKENDCLVTINGKAYDTSVSVWIRLNWELENDNSMLSTDLRQHGVNGPDWVRADFLHEEFCVFLKKQKK